MQTRPERVSVLFLCTGNSCRSQMAEAWTRHLWPDRLAPHSAGVVARGIDRRAVLVMAERGVDISGQRSKTIDDLVVTHFDWVVTVCDNARESCPVFPSATRIKHVGFDDPPQLAKTARTEAEALGHYRRVRDEIERFIEHLPGLLSNAES